MHVHSIIRKEEDSMAEHHVSVTINAPVHQVYTLFTHFNDFPKFMSFVKEVTYYDDQRTHWVVQVLGRREWDAINESWIEDSQIGWRSTSGLENTGKVKFISTGPDQTVVNVYIHYTPPAGILGEIGEKLGGDSRFDAVLQEDLNHFARMVEQAPPGALNPMSSHYLFHSDSSVAQGTTTDRQKASMAGGLGAAKGTGTTGSSRTSRPRRSRNRSWYVRWSPCCNVPHAFGRSRF
ncbi:MAG: SRPBCC family protein [Chloroflexi bacterium]|nr:MAG: SRPBCC family protein [Chloroflexota bacterium]